MGVQYTSEPSVDVRVAWVVYDYDQVAKGYFVAFSNSATGAASPPAQGLLIKTSKTKALDIKVGFEPATEIVTPQNYALEFTVRPKNGAASSLFIGTSRLGKLFKMWGVAS
jgi:hypothetical protein